MILAAKNTCLKSDAPLDADGFGGFSFGPECDGSVEQDETKCLNFDNECLKTLNLPKETFIIKDEDILDFEVSYNMMSQTANDK